MSLSPTPSQTVGPYFHIGTDDGFIGADGGAMHLAAALRLPIVAFFDNLENHGRRWHPSRH